MKHRILSLLVAVILCLGVCPVQALMAAEADTPPVADSGLAQEEAQGAPRKAAARASASDAEINMDYYDSYKLILAQGVPIVIKENNDITSIFDTNGNLLSGDKDVSECIILGGWFGSSPASGTDIVTSITMESGTVKWLCGGCYGGKLIGKTKITMTGGTVDIIYGGGYQSTLIGNSSIDINGGTATFVYGSGFKGQQQGSTTIHISNSEIDSVYGGGDGSVVKDGDTNIIIDNSTVKNNVYGGGGDDDGDETKGVGGNTNVTISGDSTIGRVYGGGRGTMVTGTANVTINEGVKITGYPDTDDKGIVFGGGNGGQVKKTNVIFNGGDLGELYGGGEGCTVVESSYIQIMANPDNVAKVYGGGKFGTVKKATVKLHNIIESYAENHTRIYGGGNSDNVEEVEILIDNSCDINSVLINACAASSTVGSANFHVTVSDQGVYTTPDLYGVSGEGVTGKVTASFSGIGTAYQPFTTRLPGVDEVFVEGCQFQFSAFDDASGVLNLDRLEVAPSGEVLLTNELNDVTIGELAGRGTIRFFGLNKGDIPTVRVNSVDASALIRVARRGGLVTDEIWENTVLFQGAGIEALDSADCFVAVEDDAHIYVPQKTEDGTGIVMVKADNRMETMIETAYCDKATYQYGESIQVIAKLVSLGPDGHIPMAGERVSLVSGREGPRIIAESVTGADGLATFTLPVRDSLWNDFPDSTDSYLVAFFDGTESHLGSRSLVYLKDGGLEYHFSFEKTNIVLEETITPPEVDQVPSVLLSPGKFYTTQVEWNPVDALFRPNQAYTASIRIIPKTGYSLTPDRINSVTYGGKELTFPENVEADGSLLFKTVETYDPIPAYHVTLIASPAEGGTVTGGGSYVIGSQVAVSAAPAQGWKFTGWKENGAVVCAEPAYSFAAAANRTLTAHFEKEQAGQSTKVKTDALTTVPEGLKNNPSFDTVEKIIAELRQKVEAAISEVGDSLVVYDVRLVYLDGREVEPGRFPKEGIDTILDYPSGTNGTDYIFTVQHMISYGPDAGKVETLTYTAEPTGLKCHFGSLSPVAIGWQKKTAPAPDPTTPTGGSSSSDSDEDNDRDDFWQEVLQQIEQAKPGATLRINAKDRDKLPRKVMNALKQSGITLVIRWSGGEDIVLSSDQALDEPRRFFYPLAYLSSYDFDAAADTQSPDTQNPDDSLSEAAASVNQNPATGDSAVSIALLLSAAACGGIWVCKGKSKQDKS